MFHLYFPALADACQEWCVSTHFPHSAAALTAASSLFLRNISGLICLSSLKETLIK